MTTTQTSETRGAARSLYGRRQLADSMRAVRQNTILMAGDIPESKYGFRATPGTRSIAEALVHIAWLSSADRLIHEERRLGTLEGFDFPALLATSAAGEQVVRSKEEIIALLRAEGDRAARWVEACPTTSSRSGCTSPAAARRAVSR